ncbi:hypothetical protein [Clostridium sp. UBA1652]|uniref:hypothetical protein n=1 Tax=Clostridium sp. UBA1652 TaxID=1946348 RepID=UPI00257E474B|nr:hypothetical protein [Clostridium sp. UBA1652]
MNQNIIEILKIVVPVVGTILAGMFAYNIKNKNSIKNKKSNNINNSTNTNVQGNNYGINNKIEK